MYLQCKDATEAFDELYLHLESQYYFGFSQPSRAGEVAGEILNAHIEILDPTRGIVQSKIRKMPMRYAVGELLWYLSGSNKVKDISKYSKFWGDISDDDVTLNSAYGHRIWEKFGFDQWTFVKEKLQANPNDRQAVIHIKDADPNPSKDVPCTCLLQFHLREEKLYLTVYMRSNDIWLGFPFDVFAFTSLQTLMAMELGVDLGSYTHIAGSLHLYEKDVVKWYPILLR